MATGPAARRFQPAEAGLGIRVSYAAASSSGRPESIDNGRSTARVFGTGRDGKSFGTRGPPPRRRVARARTAPRRARGGRAGGPPPQRDRRRDLTVAPALSTPVELGLGVHRDRLCARRPRARADGAAVAVRGQWRNGPLPHIVFSEGARYFPAPSSGRPSGRARRRRVPARPGSSSRRSTAPRSPRWSATRGTASARPRSRASSCRG